VATFTTSQGLALGYPAAPRAEPLAGRQYLLGALRAPSVNDRLVTVLRCSPSGRAARGWCQCVPPAPIEEVIAYGPSRVSGPNAMDSCGVCGFYREIATRGAQRRLAEGERANAADMICPLPFALCPLTFDF
jgi:hypothetical protein